MAPGGAASSKGRRAAGRSKGADGRKGRSNTVMRVFLAVAAIGTLFSVGYAVGRGRPPPPGGRAAEQETTSSSSPQEVDDDAGPSRASATSSGGGDSGMMKPLSSKKDMIADAHKLGAKLKKRRPRGERPSLLRGAAYTKDAPRPVAFYSGGLNESLVVPPFWIPMEIAHVEHGDPRVTLCKLDVDGYWRNPTRTPMFRDLVSASRCSRGKSGSLSSLYEEAMSRERKPLSPSGFVFHESRVGSTLIANMLASVPTNLVYSESAPPPAVINHCRSCTTEQRTTVLRQLFALMGASPVHERLFFKFQSITVPNIAILSAAFPETPWIFVYRDPVQVMMSHFKHGVGGHGAPCLREHKRPRAATARILDPTDASKASSASAERYCAAHLAMLCEHALENDKAAGAKALMVNYDSLPGSLVHYVVPHHFGLADAYDDDMRRRMLDVANVYSKRRKTLPADAASGDAGQKSSSSKPLWGGDSEEKENAASPKVKKAAEELMRPRFEKLLRATTEKTGGDDLLAYKHRPIE